MIRAPAPEESLAIAARRVEPVPVSTASPAPPPSRLDFPNLLALAQQPEAIEWQPFQPGVEIHRLYGDGLTGPSAALLYFREGGVVPLHEHTGYEHILVLTGTQSDEAGPAGPGALRIHPPGTRHRVESEAGCIVLAIYERPVRFI